MRRQLGALLSMSLLVFVLLATASAGYLAWRSADWNAALGVGAAVLAALLGVVDSWMKRPAVERGGEPVESPVVDLRGDVADAPQVEMIQVPSYVILTIRSGHPHHILVLTEGQWSTFEGKIRNGSFERSN